MRQIYKTENRIGNGQELQYKYHAFVAHNHTEDMSWVVDKLLPKVEEDWNFTCCVGYRDFEPGVPIAENIVNAIDSSMKTILVLAPGFAASQWCNFEMHMALSRGTENLVMLYLEDIPVGAMSSTLRALVRGTNYIPWEDGQQEEDRFWTRLKDVLDTKNE